MVSHLLQGFSSPANSVHLPANLPLLLIGKEAAERPGVRTAVPGPCDLNKHFHQQWCENKCIFFSIIQPNLCSCGSIAPLDVQLQRKEQIHIYMEILKTSRACHSITSICFGLHVPQRLEACCSPAPYKPSFQLAERHPNPHSENDPKKKINISSNLQIRNTLLKQRLFIGITFFNLGWYKAWIQSTNTPLLWWTALLAQVLKPPDSLHGWREFYLQRGKKNILFTGQQHKIYQTLFCSSIHTNQKVTCILH